MGTILDVLIRIAKRKVLYHDAAIKTGTQRRKHYKTMFGSQHYTLIN